jgi:hypothetical protein
MSLSDVVLLYSLLSGIMSALLITVSTALVKEKKKSRDLLIWGTVFLGVCFGLSEYALWLGGHNLFHIVFSFNFPLLAFFTVWFAFLIWRFESMGERKVWVAFLIILIILIITAVNCMNCFYNLS